MDINELLGKARGAIGKIKWVGNDSTSELITKAKAAVANTKPRPKKPVVTNEPKVTNTTIGNPDLKVDTIVNETIGEKLAQNGAGHVTNIGMAAAPKAIGDAAIEKMIDKKYPNLDDKVDLAPNNMAEHDNDVEEMMMWVATLADLPAAAATKLLPLATKQIGRLAGKKVAPEAIESLMKKTNFAKALEAEGPELAAKYKAYMKDVYQGKGGEWFSHKQLAKPSDSYLPKEWVDEFEEATGRWGDADELIASFLNRKRNPDIVKSLDTAYERGFGSNNGLEQTVKNYFEKNKTFNGLDDYISSNHPNLIREVSKKSAE